MSCGVDRRRCGGMRPTRGPPIDGDGDTLTIPEDRIGNRRQRCRDHRRHVNLRRRGGGPGAGAHKAPAHTRRSRTRTRQPAIRPAPTRLFCALRQLASTCAEAPTACGCRARADVVLARCLVPSSPARTNADRRIGRARESEYLAHESRPNGDAHRPDGAINGTGGYWRAIAMRKRSSAVMRWSRSSALSSMSICTQWMRPVNSLSPVA